MLRLTSPKTYQTLEHILSVKEFTQTSIKDAIEISIGRVNKIVRWLVEKGIVIKDKGRYSLIKPNLLVEIISMQISIKNKMFFSISSSKKDIIKILKKNGAVICLGTALENYEDYSDDEIHLYFNEKIIDILNKMERGDLKINLYESNIILPSDLTSKIRTIIDLQATGNSKAASRLLIEEFGTMQ